MTHNGNARPTDSESPPESLTHEQIQHIIKTGEEASRLLGSQVYNMMYNQLLQSLFHEWLGSEVKEERKREGLYHQAQGLIQVTDRLAGVVNEARALLAEQQAQHDPKQQARDYQDAQGFGLNYQ